MLLHSPGYQQVESSTGTSGGQCGQLKHQYKAGDDRMEKLLLTVWEAADVIGQSRVTQRIRRTRVQRVP